MKKIVQKHICPKLLGNTICTKTTTTKTRICKQRKQESISHNFSIVLKLSPISLINQSNVMACKSLEFVSSSSLSSLWGNNKMYNLKTTTTTIATRTIKISKTIRKWSGRATRRKNHNKIYINLPFILKKRKPLLFFLRLLSIYFCLFVSKAN